MAREHLLRVTIADCRMETFRAGGPGGQNQNKRNTGVRIVHVPSGAVGEAREERSQLANKRRAFTRMAESAEFKRWVRIVTGDIDRIVNEQMRPENLEIEYGIADVPTGISSV